MRGEGRGKAPNVGQAASLPFFVGYAASVPVFPFAGPIPSASARHWSLARSLWHSHLFDGHASSVPHEKWQAGSLPYENVSLLSTAAWSVPAAPDRRMAIRRRGGQSLESFSFAPHFSALTPLLSQLRDNLRFITENQLAKPEFRAPTKSGLNGCVEFADSNEGTGSAGCDGDWILCFSKPPR